VVRWKYLSQPMLLSASLRFCKYTSSRRSVNPVPNVDQQLPSWSVFKTISTSSLAIISFPNRIALAVTSGTDFHLRYLYRPCFAIYSLWFSEPFRQGKSQAHPCPTRRCAEFRIYTTGLLIRRLIPIYYDSHRFSSSQLSGYTPTPTYL
jgi:hypothetical protein